MVEQNVMCALGNQRYGGEILNQNNRSALIASPSSLQEDAGPTSRTRTQKIQSDVKKKEAKIPNQQKRCAIQLSGEYNTKRWHRVGGMKLSGRSQESELISRK